jgi:serine/threonine-protein kinase
MKPDPLIERYSIIRKINSGGMATVFLVEDKKLQRTVALKKLHPHLLEHAETVTRFTNEAKAIASLSHENIIKIYDFGESSGGPFLVMEYIDGITLSELLEQHGKIPNSVVFEIARQIASGLNCSHSQGIIHRDIKPSNILIQKDGTIIITDFGIAYIAQNQSITMTGSFVGSPHYVSPEQIQGEKVTGKADIYSLGVVLYQCISGVLPFDADTPHGIINSILNNAPREIYTLNRSILYWLSDLIGQCIQKDPQLRPDPDTIRNTIEKKASDDSLKISKSSIADFQNSPHQFIDRENETLFSIYRTKGLNELTTKKLIHGLKNLDQAERFGNLSADDSKIKHRAIKKSKRTPRDRWLYSILIFLVLITSITIAILVKYPPLPVSQNLHDNNLSVSSDTQTITDSTSMSQPERLSSTSDTNTSIVNEPPEPSKKLRPTIQNTIDSSEKHHLNQIQKDSTNEPSEGYLRILTNPPWVTIYIDGIERGKTPKLNTVILEKGIHSMVLTKEGYQTHIDSITIVPSDTQTLRIRLQAKDLEGK